MIFGCIKKVEGVEMALQRTHILLEPEQQQRLAEIARSEGRSVSEVAREMIHSGIRRKDQELKRQRDKRLAALANVELVRKEILDEYGELGIDVVELMAEIREGRDADILDSRD
jgi:hypothetical protein